MASQMLHPCSRLYICQHSPNDRHFPDIYFRINSLIKGQCKLFQRLFSTFVAFYCSWSSTEHKSLNSIVRGLAQSLRIRQFGSGTVTDRSLIYQGNRSLSIFCTSFILFNRVLILSRRWKTSNNKKRDSLQCRCLKTRAPRTQKWTRYSPTSGSPYWEIVAVYGPWARFSKVPKLNGPFSGVTIPFVSQERNGFKSSNFTVIFLSVTLKTR